MKRAHRSAHHVLWLLMVPVLAAMFWFALDLRPEAPVNDTLPTALSEEG